MKNLSDLEQIELFNFWQATLPPKNFERLNNSLYGVFRSAILGILPAQKLGENFSDNLGRKTKELYSICGLLLLKEFNNWTTTAAVDAYLFDKRIHYALDTGDQVTLCERTLERYAKLVGGHETLAEDIFNKVTAKVIEILDIEVDRQRLDSTHIYSDMATFTRTKLMAVAIKRFLVQLKRHELKLYMELSPDIRLRYEKKEQAMFNDITKENRPLLRQEVAEQMHVLIQKFSGVDAIENMTTFKRMTTVFMQQCEVVDPKIIEDKKAKKKSRKDDSIEPELAAIEDDSIDSAPVVVQDDTAGKVVQVRKKTGQNVMQNTSDPDATYDGHKGPGYQIQIAETSNPANAVQIITAVIPQTAAEFDTDAVVPVIESLTEREISPNTLLVDSGYASDENVITAQEKGVELVGPVAGPAPKTPYKKPSEKQLRLQQRRLEQQTPEWKKEYNTRAQIEGLNSALKRRTGLGKLRYRGKRSVFMSVFLKLAGWNISRAAAGFAKTGKKMVISKKCNSLTRKTSVIWPFICARAMAFFICDNFVFVFHVLAGLTTRGADNARTIESY